MKIYERDFKLNIIRFRVINPQEILAPYKNQKRIILDDADFKSYKSKTIGSSEILFLLSVYSCEKYLTDPNNINLKVYMDVDNFQDYFKSKYDYLRNFCLKNNNSGTLVLGGDVIFRDFANFSNFDGMKMFNFASINKKHTSRAGDRPHVNGGSSFFDYYMNADVMYFAPNTNLSIWEVGDSWRNNWIEGMWEYEQDMYNAMYRFQNGSTIPQVYPEYAYQLPVNELTATHKLRSWNNINITDAKVIHLHSSRNIELSLEVAHKILNNELDFIDAISIKFRFHDLLIVRGLKKLIKKIFGLSKLR